MPIRVAIRDINQDVFRDFTRDIGQDVCLPRDVYPSYQPRYLSNSRIKASAEDVYQDTYRRYILRMSVEYVYPGFNARRLPETSAGMCIESSVQICAKTSRGDICWTYLPEDVDQRRLSDHPLGNVYQRHIYPRHLSAMHLTETTCPRCRSHMFIGSLYQRHLSVTSLNKTSIKHVYARR